METQELTTVKMDPELKAKWVTALNDSTRFVQTKEVLYKETLLTGAHCMCCLGVLEYLCGSSLDVLEEGLFDEVPSSLPDQKSPSEVLNQDIVGQSRDVEEYLAYMNDNGYTFQQIAEWIDKNL